MSKENMKELMEQLKAAKSDEERKQILENSNNVLTEEELEQVSGGRRPEFDLSDDDFDESKRDLDRDYGRDWDL